ncbi:zinc finger protein VAR3, chloroplastic [Juglans microcarpa x Juglans regia]|uniref:zinc finger protein VAR3, chloroplastic n=1 Tax=Juglans microcarpa x Juglans regia TaxID=2249226 RepID=UPI001B7DE0A8|nr:zinc finger protein VAR3, chloroplastic [Juglans microcarpa x Juglans regia]
MGGATRLLVLLNATSPFPLLLHQHRRRCPSLLRLSRRHRLLSSSLSSHHLHHLFVSPSPSPSVKASQSHRQLHTRSSSALRDDHFLRSSNRDSHPWPEWSAFLQTLSLAGYFHNDNINYRPESGDVSAHEIGCEVEFVASADLPDEFVRAASACLAFARDRANLLGLLSMKDVEVVVGNGSPFLFKDGDDSVRKMASFLHNGESYVSDSNKALTVDLMKFILSYVSNGSVSSEKSNCDRETVETSVRNLLSEFAKLSYSSSQSNTVGSHEKHPPERSGQTPSHVGQTVEMKRGDWICPRCSFMNFARNMKCLECEETRPKRQLTGGEWECPQCDFFNYGRNRVCLRCDCKRPGEILLGSAHSISGVGYGNGTDTNKAGIDSRLAANEEKAQRWFSKVSQLDSSSDMSSAIADEDFPEIMPLRKGVNRFVVSTRKTPLERRLANAFQRNLGSDDSPEGNDLRSVGPNSTISQGLDKILGHTPVVSESYNKNITAGRNAGSDGPHYFSGTPSSQYVPPGGSNSNYVPFVPLPADMFAQPENAIPQGSEKPLRDNQKSLASNTIEWTSNASGSNESDKSGGSLQQSQNPVSQIENKNKENQEAEKSERWFKRVAELHNVTDISSAISDEDFPEIMPMRKGENRFVVSKKKDRSLTSPAYKRRMAMEQASSTNFVPFVPFPSDYFAKKDKPQPEGTDSSKEGAEDSSASAMPKDKPQPDGTASSNEAAEETSASDMPKNHLEKSYDARPNVLHGNNIEERGNQNISIERLSEKPAGENLTETDVRSRYPRKENTNETPNFTSSPQQSENENIRERWTGKSLEGSAVKEPDPLDMSEEAKAERWFRRVAQIKDISELSQIPDEDFPSIMPMRKGVNRFVVSKRKTPLERRLTSSQYRRNLPIVNSDPVKENDGS